MRKIQAVDLKVRPSTTGVLVQAWIPDPDFRWWRQPKPSRLR